MPSQKCFSKKLRICLKQIEKTVVALNTLSEETEVIKNQVEILELNDKIQNWEKNKNSMDGLKRMERKEEKISEGGDRTI